MENIKYLVREGRLEVEKVKLMESKEFKGQTVFISDLKGMLEFLRYSQFIFNTEIEAWEYIALIEEEKIRNINKKILELIENYKYE